MSKCEELTIRQAQELVKKFLVEQGREWTQIDNHFYVFTHLVEETGELARHIITAELNLSLDRRKSESIKREEILSLIQDDLGDILYHIFKIAVAYNIDLNESFRRAMSNIRARYAVG
jgi:NTP pyrophosphatase (non-canonical NTP hydrolase)